jgi:hypothetical protein
MTGGGAAVLWGDTSAGFLTCKVSGTHVELRLLKDDAAEDRIEGDASNHDELRGLIERLGIEQPEALSLAGGFVEQLQTLREGLPPGASGAEGARFGSGRTWRDRLRRRR